MPIFHALFHCLQQSERLSRCLVFKEDPHVIPKRGISEEDYQHAKKALDVLKCGTSGRYTKLYCFCDTLLLADVFENFIDTSLHNYG